MALHTASQADKFSLLQWLQAAVAEAEQRPPRGAQRTFQLRYTLTAAMLDNADDRVRLLWLPAGIFIFGCSVWSVDQLDEDATPALVWDLITETDAGVADARKLISAATAGRVAAGDGADMDAGGAVHAGERYVVFDPTTAAATAAEGDILLTITLGRGIATDQLPAITMDAV